MKKIIFMAILGFASLQLNAQGIYDISKIPVELLENARIVVRNEELTYEVKGPGSAIQQYKTAVTILNKSGEGSSNLVEYYDNFSNISNLKASLYDAKGQKIKEYRAADFKDRSAVSNGSMYEDSRVKYLEFLHTTFPYTIEYSYEIDYKGILSYPSWFAAAGFGMAVEKSSYTFKIPKELSFKYLHSKDLKTDSILVKDKMEYKWSCSSIPALDSEPLSTGLKTVNPWVTVAPNQFEYDHSKANIENWKNLGSWMYELSKNSQVLSEPAKAKVQNIVKTAGSAEEKVSLLYKYLQENTRYVGVQLGIGGFQPISAEKVSSVNYGDCKGLSNYMKSLLEEAGIKSNLVVIGNGMPSLNRKYASMNQANHMILCVPMAKDTTWLECTSNYSPAGFIGNNNSGRTVLLVTADGGKLVETPILKPEHNYMHSITKVNLNEEGSAEIQIDTKYANAQYEDQLGMMLSEPINQRKRIMNSFSIPNIEITSLNYTQPDKTLPVINSSIQLKSSQLMTKGADKLFLTLNLLNRVENTLAVIENRRTPFAVKYGYMDEDEVIYTIPKGFKVEFIPKDVTVDSEFGKYTATSVVKDNTLIYTRKIVISNKTYPAEKYNDYVAFRKKLYQADKQKSILAKI
ncbi:DUF3857 domain-containing protein [Pedobacter sp. PLR]|uniref:DUF3857 domain-containing protein n=1 Tax=Pedobacter sp. PLR TaxID=2994465 RepID=UPI002247C71A|nr:DUF3857 domain-containing protein [Pedobacter sp. PLR]MCX2452179.1 DUF3857 domain-containing protein [Pedobacter sp. PLR]